MGGGPAGGRGGGRPADAAEPLRTPAARSVGPTAAASCADSRASAARSSVSSSRPSTSSAPRPRTPPTPLDDASFGGQEARPPMGLVRPLAATRAGQQRTRGRCAPGDGGAPQGGGEFLRGATAPGSPSGAVEAVTARHGDRAGTAERAGTDGNSTSAMAWSLRQPPSQVGDRTRSAADQEPPRARGPGLCRQAQRQPGSRAPWCMGR